jgi:tonB-linked outer membrane protein, susC/ragA family
MRKYLYLFAFLLCTLSSLWPQKGQITVTGVVLSSESMAPINAATVQCIEYPRVGTMVNDKGRFTLQLPADAKSLRVSYVGYETQIVYLTGKPLRIVLTNKDQSLDQVVIVAYGTQKKQSVVGAQASLNAKQLANRPVTNAVNALAGASPGIQVTASSGQPGDAGSIRIRGFGSINASSSPLYIVDGSVYHGSISDIPAQDIANISVLKDAAATALYGASAGNGVVIVTTKRNGGGASDGVARFTFSMSQGFSQRGLPEHDKVGAMEHYKLRWQQWYNQYRYDPENKDKSDAELGTLAALDTYSSLRYNPYAGIQSYYQKDPATGKYLLAKGAPGKGKIPGILLPNGEMNPEITGLLYGDDLDWNKSLYRMGHRSDYTLSGGLSTKNLKSYLSLGYLNETGYMIQTGYQRYTARTNLSYNVRPWLTLGTSSSLIHTHSESPRTLGNANANGARFAQHVAPIYPIHRHDLLTGKYLKDQAGNLIYDHDEERPFSPKFNPIELAYLDLSEIDRDALVTRSFVDLKPFEGLKLTLNVNYDLRNIRGKTRFAKGTGDQAKGMLTYSSDRVTNLTVNQLANYSKSLGNHEIDVLLGHESSSYRNSSLSGSKSGLMLIPIDELAHYQKVEDFTSYTTNYNKESYFGRLNYSYDKRYNVSVSFRRDGSSRFARQNRWGNFWSVGAGWNISSESFMSTLTWIDELKLRGSHGETGNDLLSNYFPYQTLYSINNNLEEAGLRTANLGNVDLTWETQVSSDIALEFGLFHRLRGSIELFNKESKGLLFDYPLPTSSGVASIDRNIGKIRNRGVELDLSLRLLSLTDFSWSVRANATWLSNKLLRLPDLNRKDGILVDGVRKYLEGHSIYDYFINEYLGVDPADGKAMYRLDKERFPDEPGLEASGERASYTKNGEKARKHFKGSSIPDVYGGFSTDFTYKNFTLGVNFAYQLGGYAYDGVYQSLMSRDLQGGTAMHPDLRRAWRKPGQVTDVPRLDASSREYATLTSDRFLISASALSLKSVSLSYTFPKALCSKLHISGLNLAIAGENLYLFSKRRGLNPFNSYSGISSTPGYDVARTLTTTLNVSF